MDPHLRGRAGLNNPHSFEWPFLQKFLCTKNSETICSPSPKYCLSDKSNTVQ